MKSPKNKPEGITTEKTIGSDPWEALLTSVKGRLPERPENGKTFHEFRAALGVGRDRARRALDQLIEEGRLTPVDGVLVMNGQLRATRFYVPVKRGACSARSESQLQALAAR